VACRFQLASFRTELTVAGTALVLHQIPFSSRVQTWTKFVANLQKIFITKRI